MSSYKICVYCGEYEHDCHCRAARDLGIFVSEIRGCLKGLLTHPSDVPTNGCLISEGSKEKLKEIGKVLDRYDTKEKSK